MRIIVVHEDGDRSSRVSTLADEVRKCIKTGSMRVIGVSVEVQHEGMLHRQLSAESHD